LAGIIISIISFLDDIYDLDPKIRLVVHASVAIVGLVFLGGFSVLDFGLFSITNSIITNLVAFVAIIWYINLYNFLDGINGYAGSEAIFLAVAGFVVFGGNHFLILVVSVLGFLYWNWNDAKIFMGDAGSTLLGYNVSIFTIYYTNQEPTNLWIWIILFSLFWFDATVTLVRRKLDKEKITVAHKKHAYQRLIQGGWSHYKVTNYSIGLNIVLFCIVYFMSNLFISFMIAMIFMYSVMSFVDREKKI